MLERYCGLFRVVWLSGRYGGGKTSLALHLADRLVAAGDVQFVACNFPLRVGRVVAEYESFQDMVDNTSDVCIIYDEGWQDLGVGASPKAIRQYLAYLRKRSSILLIPSVLPLSRSVAAVRVVRKLNALIFGLPLWWYEFSVDCGIKKPETGNYFWWRPQRVWGWYDNRSLPTSTSAFAP